MSANLERAASDVEATVRRLDYQRLLRQSREAFDEGDAREGLELLELAAGYEAGAGSSDPDDMPPAAA